MVMKKKGSKCWLNCQILVLYVSSLVQIQKAPVKLWLNYQQARDRLTALILSKAHMELGLTLTCSKTAMPVV